MKYLMSFMLAIFLLMSHNAWGQNDKFKALFIYNFTKYIEWPMGGSQNFVITVLGESPIMAELSTISKVKKVGQLSIEVRKASSVADIGETQIVYVPAAKSRFLADIMAKTQGRNILIITDELLERKNININFTVKDGKQSFEISKSKLELHHLKVNSGLLALGIAVE